jgi:2-dehydropantoate 2-reductase
VRIGVFGAGSIGCYLGGRLLAAGADVVLVGRLGDELAAHGLTLVDVDGTRTVLPAARLAHAADAAALADREIVLVTVKSTDTAAAGAVLAGVLAPGATVVSFQNGVSNPDLLRAALGTRRVVAGMVPWNVVRLGAGGFQQTTTGPVGIERGAGEAFLAALRRTRLPLDVRDDLRGVQWTKLLLNLNNSVNALAGVPLRQELAQRDYRRVFAAAFAEGLACLRAAGLRPVRVGRMLPALAPAILQLPDALFFRLAAALVKIDPAARSSMLDDLDRKKATEVDFLNGEIVRLGERHGVATPVNRRIVALVHAAEAAGTGSPGFTARNLLAEVGAAASSARRVSR